MVEPELDLFAHELSSSEEAAGGEECFCECGLPPGEDCYTCWDCTSVCDGGGGIRCLCSTCFCEGCVASGDSDGQDGALAGNDGDDGDDDGGGQGDDGANESV